MSFDVLKNTIKSNVVAAHKEYCNDSIDIEDKDICMVYKSATAHGLGTTLKTMEDFVNFCKEYVELDTKKTMLISVTMIHEQQKKKSNKKRVGCFVLFWSFCPVYCLNKFWFCIFYCPET